MPKMGGVELSLRVRELHPQIPVLFMSGYTGRFEVNELLQIGSFLEKPFTPSSLLETVNKALSTESCFSTLRPQATQG